ncbi:MAG: hypothetical protein ACI398_04055 [Clostridium sp.]
MKFKDWLIHSLGGYTKKEYTRVERKYQALLDSKTDTTNIKLCNEYIYRTLITLDNYIKNLYGISSNEWSQRVYNVIHNNLLRIITRYISVGSSVIYTIDTTLESKDEFLKVLQNDKH